MFPNILSLYYIHFQGQKQVEAQREAQRVNPDLPIISISSCQKMTATFLDLDHSASSQFYVMYEQKHL